MKRIGIIGLGLMGGSLALAIKKKLPELAVAGYDQNSKHLQFARINGFIDDVLSPADMKEMDIIFLATPVRSIPVLISKIKPELNLKKTLITDLASTKSFLYRKITKEFPSLNYVGGHPMTGREVSGPEGARADLFQGKNYILIKPVNENNNYQILISLIKRIGSKLIFLTPEEHDTMVALTSHLPQLLASSIINMLNDSGNETSLISNLMGEGFMDFSRIAASNPAMWLDIFLTNKNNILEKIDGFIEQLNLFKTLLIDDRESEIYKFLSESKKRRIEIGKVKKDEFNRLPS